MFNYIFSINPIIRYLASQIGETSGINIVKREVPIIVSISSDENNFKDLELSLYSILNQSVCPDKIILWLSNEYELSELPYSITRFIKNGLEIKFVENKNDYNRIIYALKEYNNAIIITASDDIIYPKDWLKKLYHSFITNPQDIHVHKALNVSVTQKELVSYGDWTEYTEKESAEYSNFLVMDGGILFPPKCFTKEVFREDIYNKKLTISADIWLWFMALTSGRKIRVVKNHIKILPCTNILKKMFKNNKKEYIKSKNEQIRYLMEFYKQNILNKLK